MSPISPPPFRAFVGLAGGHRQTLAGVFWPEQLPAEQAVLHRVVLDDGELVVLHDDVPVEWGPRGPVAIMVHGLAGCHRSGYLVRIAKKLNARGVRTFRMDLRGCGAGATLASKPYHGGCSDDLRAAVRCVEQLCPKSPITLLGFSLGGNIVLKLLGEVPDQLSGAIVNAAAVNPPIDLEQSVLNLQRWSLRAYDRYFVNLLLQRVRERQRLWPDSPQPTFSRPPATLFDFDDQFTAPVCGFRDAHDYYEQCSSRQFLGSIRVPTLMLTAQNDPLVPVTLFGGLSLPESVSLQIAEGGGHLGYLARRGSDPDGRWLDWRIVERVLGE